MANKIYDAVVVGGGPAGGRVAGDIAAAGFRVAVLERDDSIGQPVQCSGLVTHRTLLAAGLSPDVSINQLTGAAIFSPSGIRYEIGGDRVHAYVLDRGRFDQQVMTESLETGLDLFTNTRVTKIERYSQGSRVIAERFGAPMEFQTPLVIGADGPRSLVAHFLELPPPIELLRARGADVRLPRMRADHQVQIFVGERYAPGFFAWAIPLGDDRYRIGWGTSRSTYVRDPLAALTCDFPSIFDGMTVISQTGGLVPLGPRRQTVANGGMVVGDAAGQAKATSGGGLFTSLTCAAHCARVAVDALKAGDTSAAQLSAYDRAWRDDIGGELARASALRSAYRSLNDSELEWGLRLLRLPGIREVVDRYGDIDYPSWLASAALRSAPRIKRLLRGHGDTVAALSNASAPQLVVGD